MVMLHVGESARLPVKAEASMESDGENPIQKMRPMLIEIIEESPT